MAHQLTIRLLGNVSIELDGKPIKGFPSRKAEALLVYLVCHERPFPREFLADLLWEDRSQKQALANLRSVLSSLRRELGPFLIITRQIVAFNHETDYWLDLKAFTAAINASQTHPHLNLEDCAECLGKLETAVTLYNGRFLQGLLVGDSKAFEEWSLMMHEQTHRQVLTAFHQLSSQYARQGKYAQAQQYALRQVELEPYREEAHRQIMLTMIRSGQRSAALAQYETCRRILNEELGVEPTFETRAMYQRIRSAGKASPHNLPPQQVPLIGREKELQQIAAYLADSACRLLTLIGPGGIGKTLLALQAAREHTGIYLHGTYFIPLAPIADPTLLGTTIADAIHCRVDGASDLQSQLLDFLREKEMLLILDNFEHLLTGGSWISQIIEAAPHVKILVTSRERLNIRPEYLLEVRGLSHPAVDDGDMEEAIQYGAIQLFLREARRVKSNYDPSQNEMQHIVRICQYLEGMPLGIELAAAWVRLVTGEKIWQEIDRDLDFLATAVRDVPERHQSMRLVFRQSWLLLAPNEQAVLCQLTVFRSPFSQVAARQVTGASFSLLLSLVNKSMLRRTASGRFDLHELLKQYLIEKLVQDPKEEIRVRDAHGRYFANFLEEREQALKGGQQAQALAEIVQAIEDIRAAWQWSIEQKQYALLNQATESLYLFFWARNRFSEGKALFAQTIEIIAKETLTDEISFLLTRLQSRMAEMMVWLGEYEAAEALLQQSIAVNRRQQANYELMLALEILGRLFYAQSVYHSARQCFTESLAIARQIEAKAGIAQALSNLASTICTETADYSTARSIYDESMAVFREMDDQFGIAKIIINLGAIEHEEANYVAAKEYCEQSLQIYRSLDYRYGIGAALTYLGDIAQKMADYTAAKQLLEESLALSRDSGHRNAIIESLISLGRVSIKTNIRQDAVQYLSEALQMAVDIQSPNLILSVLKEYARLFFVIGEEERAITCLQFLLNYPLEAQELKEQARNLLNKYVPNTDLESTAYALSQPAESSLEDMVEAVLDTRILTTFS